jgi:putative DNA primase/helicase
LRIPIVFETESAGGTAAQAGDGHAPAAQLIQAATAAAQFTAADGWVLRRLLSGCEQSRDTEAASPGFRAQAQCLASQSLDDRRREYSTLLKQHPDAAAIQRAVRQADPRAEAPGSAPADPRPGGAQPNSAPPGRDRAETGDSATMTAPAKVIRAADITPRPIDWFWPYRVPLGMLTLFAGDPKLGKSFVTLAMAAAASRGWPLPGAAGRGNPDPGLAARPVNTLILSAEDDPARTIVPRLIAAGADLTRVHILESVTRGSGGAARLRLDQDLATLEAVAAGLGDCRLILIDPITAFLGRVDDHRNAALRGLLTPLNDLAERLRAAVVVVNHLRKSGGINGLHRVLGSMGYGAACRANFLFVPDRSDPSGRRVLMCHNGGNLAPPAPTLAYTIADRPEGARVEWSEEPLDFTVEQALAAERAAVRQSADAPERREAEQWLREVLGAGPVAAADIEDWVRGCPFSFRTVQIAKKALGIAAHKVGYGRDGRWYWRLPGDCTH